MPRVDATVIDAHLRHLDELLVTDPRGHVPASLRDLRDVYRQILELVQAVNTLPAESMDYSSLNRRDSMIEVAERSEIRSY